MQLITYADRLAGNLSSLNALLAGELKGLFSGVHLLPFFDPIDGEDAGFDPIDHRRVDPKIGNWDDVRALAANHTVMADLIVNHISADSPQFLDVQRKGRKSRYWELFLRKRDVFEADQPAGENEAAIKQIYRPRPGIPFTTLTLDDGSDHSFWTTFSHKQLDINVESPAGRAYLQSILDRFAESGVREIRLDAAGYAIKRRGTRCFMLPETFDFIGSLSERARALGMETLVEVHAHYQTQINIASRVGRVYDFALPPLVLHTLYRGSADALKRWLSMAPRNSITVLDTHDGIGIVDIAGDEARAGLISDDEVNALVETIHEKTRGASKRASGRAASNLDIYQVNSTFYDALGRDDTDYLLARAIQFFAPGTPQVYYVGLLAGENDTDLIERTGVGRDINRHYYSPAEISTALRRPVVAQLLNLIRFRNEASAFEGEFSLRQSDQDELLMHWEHNGASATLRVELGRRRATISAADQRGARQLTIESGRVCEESSGDARTGDA